MTDHELSALVVSEDPYARGALAAVRSLGCAGWAVGVGSPEKGSLAASRWSRRWHSVPAPGGDSRDFVAWVNKAIRDGGYKVVFGAGDASVLALTQHSAEINAELPYPPHLAVQRSMDKLALADAAREVGLRTPHMTPELDEAVQASPPIVVKPRWHWLPADRPTPLRLEAAVCTNVSELTARALAIRSAGGQPLFQEVVAGRLAAVTLLVDKSQDVVACVQQEAPRTWPPQAGVSARATTVPIDRGLVARSTELLRKLDWFGLAELQFIDAGDGDDPFLIDLNGRFFGSMSLAIAAGVDLPAMWASLAIDGHTRHPGSIEALPGVHFQWLVGDLHRALVERRGGVVADVADCVRFAIGAKESVWSTDDWRPMIAYLRGLIGQAVKRR